MKIRLVVSINAAPGKGAELAQAFTPALAHSRLDAGMVACGVLITAHVVRLTR